MSTDALSSKELSSNETVADHIVSDPETDLEMCEGCRELTLRVERLETLLQQQRKPQVAPVLGTTICYWLCVGVHAFFAFALSANEGLVTFGMMLFIGSVATLTVCQVLSTRTIHMRLGRTLLSVNIVGWSSLIGLWLGDVAEPLEALPFVFAFFPPAFASAWIVAKMFVWVRGWRIVPPHHSPEHPRLQIHHLLLCTLLVAAYLAISRTLFDDIKDWIDTDVMITLAYLCIPTVACTLVSCLLLRIVFAATAPRVVLGSILLVVGSTILMAVACFAIVLLAGEASADAEILVALLVYAIPLSFGVLLSSGGTFAMMRIANYRFVCGSTESAELVAS